MDWLQYYDLIKELTGTAFAKQLFIWTSSLGVASFIHSGRVRTELSSVTLAINNLADALKKELKSHSDRLELVEKKVNELGVKVLKLEGD